MSVVITFRDPTMPEVEADEDRVSYGWSGSFVRVDHKDGKGHTLFPVLIVKRIEVRNE
jgi:hypothetical protein